MVVLLFLFVHYAIHSANDPRFLYVIYTSCNRQSRCVGCLDADSFEGKLVFVVCCCFCDSKSNSCGTSCKKRKRRKKRGEEKEK